MTHDTSISNTEPSNASLANSSSTTSTFSKPTFSRRFSTAPMMDWSDKNCRYFWRKLTQDTLLYSEMVTTGALIHGNRNRLLDFNAEEHPIALQLGGSDPQALAQCAKFAQEWHYDEVNLNVGCPSDRVQNNMIGACLMAHPQLVSDCLKAMQDAVDIDVTVKHRIGIDDQDSYQQLCDFVGTIADNGCKTFIVHARKAILKGLSPKQNRDIPPLKYDVVYQLKRDFPQLEILINGGITTHEQCAEHLKYVDGVMLGREAYYNPWILTDADHLYFGREKTDLDRLDVFRSLFPYIESELSKGATLNHIARHTLGLFHGMNGARLFRRHLSENATRKGAGLEVLEQALAMLGSNEDAEL